MHFSVLFEFSQAICHFLTALLKYNLHTIKSTHLKQYVIFTKAMTPLKIMGRSDQKKIGFTEHAFLYFSSGGKVVHVEDL